MRFVKSQEEITQIQSVYSRSHFIGVRRLTVLFETTPETVARLLPPPLEPTPEPLGTAVVADVGNSSCAGPFKYAALYVRARYEDTIGNYCIAMAASTPESVMFGRELYGEPTKLAKIIFEEQDEFVWGSAERHEIRYLSLRGRLTEPGRTGREDASTFHFKFTPRPDGRGFDSPPQLVHVIGDRKIEEARRGRGELIFRDSSHDPVSDVPVRQIIDGVYSECHEYVSGRVLCEADPEAFMPYAFSKVDSYELVAEGTLLHAQAARKSRQGKGQWRRAS